MHNESSSRERFSQLPVVASQDRISANKPAFVLADGQVLSHGQLHDASLALADWLAQHGARPGDHLACMMENRPELAVLYWGAQRAGTYYTPIPAHAKEDEASYLACDTGARFIFVSERVADLWGNILPGLNDDVKVICIDPESGDLTSLDLMSLPLRSAPQSAEEEGFAMLYSSGTTGRPKGILRPLTGRTFGTEPIPGIYRDYHVMGPDTVFLSPAPLYHAAPLRALMAVQRLGGTVVAMQRFDPLRLLELIDTHRVTHIQLVPTMMRRLLSLSEEQRSAFDLSCLKKVIHAAAPCPPDLKRAMIAWLGPIISEYYGGTEGVGMTYIDSADWLAHPGSVGRAITGKIHICDEAGKELPAGETGLVYFSDGPAFSYHNAPEKLAECSNEAGWVTLGDIGFVDEKGYLYLRDRRAFVINSGGVNIYPAEVENVIAGHPDVSDVTVIGVPDHDLGEATKAIVELSRRGVDAQAVEADIIAFTKARLSSVKAPKSVDFVSSLPRNEAGKVIKSELKQKYWQS